MRGFFKSGLPPRRPQRASKALVNWTVVTSLERVFFLERELSFLASGFSVCDDDDDDVDDSNSFFFSCRWFRTCCSICISFCNFTFARALNVYIQWKYGLCGVWKFCSASLEAWLLFQGYVSNHLVRANYGMRVPILEAPNHNTPRETCHNLSKYFKWLNLSQSGCHTQVLGSRAMCGFHSTPFMVSVFSSF